MHVGLTILFVYVISLYMPVAVQLETSPSSPMSAMLMEHEELLEIPKVGDIIKGAVLEKSRNMIFVDLGALGVGVIYGGELFDDPDAYKALKAGDEIQATVQQLDNEDGYIELSLRSATRERSWNELRSKLETDIVFEAEILDANKGGLIVRVHGITGFIPVSQLAPDHYPRVEGGDKNKILEVLKGYVAQKFKVKIINANQEDEKLILSEKAAISDEIKDVLAKLGEGKVVEGVVSGVVDFGAFVKFEIDKQELEGLVHISELAWQRIDNPADFVRVGDHVEAKVIGVDEGLRISLSIKQLRNDPWLKVAERYKVGDKVKGEIFKVTQFGGFVKLDEDIHGLIHVSELPEGPSRDPEQTLKTGEAKTFTIISLEPKEHRLGLSLKENPELKAKKKSAARETVSEEKTEEKKKKKSKAKKED